MNRVHSGIFSKNLKGHPKYELTCTIISISIITLVASTIVPTFGISAKCVSLAFVGVHFTFINILKINKWCTEGKDISYYQTSLFKRMSYFRRNFVHGLGHNPEQILLQLKRLIFDIYYEIRLFWLELKVPFLSFECLGSGMV